LRLTAIPATRERHVVPHRDHPPPEFDIHCVPHSFWRLLVQSPLRSFAAGRTKRIVVPSPNALLISNSPFSCCTRWRIPANPIPIGERQHVDSGGRGLPWPLSSTSTLVSPLRRATRMIAVRLAECR